MGHKRGMDGPCRGSKGGWEKERRKKREQGWMGGEWGGERRVDARPGQSPLMSLPPVAPVTPVSPAVTNCIRGHWEVRSVCQVQLGTVIQPWLTLAQSTWICHLCPICNFLMFLSYLNTWLMFDCLWAPVNSFFPHYISYVLKGSYW